MEKQKSLIKKLIEKFCLRTEKRSPELRLAKERSLPPDIQFWM
ncbi:MAG: hypothetical protein ACRAVC_05015 [Trichormus sp.]